MSTQTLNNCTPKVGDLMDVYIESTERCFRRRMLVERVERTVRGPLDFRFDVYLRSVKSRKKLRIVIHDTEERGRHVVCWLPSGTGGFTVDRSSTTIYRD